MDSWWESGADLGSGQILFAWHLYCNSEVPLEDVLGTGLFAMSEVEQSAGWLDSLAGHTPETEEYGIGNFVYRARKPFHPLRFHALLRAPWEGVIRVKGMFWLATRMELAGYVSQAGVLRDTRAMGFFWSAVPESEWPQDAQTQKEIRAFVEGPYGDRRTELVIIGRDMDRAALTALFDAALLTDEEFAQGQQAWAKLEDPFPSWLPAEREV